LNESSQQNVFHLRFESVVPLPAPTVWQWVTSLEGIAAEMWPYFRMTAPKNVKSIADVTVVPGERLFRSRIYLFGFLPFGYDDMTLVEYREGNGFVEESPMSSMKLWRHQRDIEATETGTRITDQLTFEPRRAAKFVGWFMQRVFRHRHSVIERTLDGASKWSQKHAAADD